MVNYYPYKLSFSERLRLLITGRMWLAVQMTELGEAQRVQIVSKPPKGAKLLTAEDLAAQALQFEEARQKLLQAQTATKIS